MTDWKQIAMAVSPSLPAQDIERIVPVLEALEKAFRPLALSIPPGTQLDTRPWTAPE